MTSVSIAPLGVTISFTDHRDSLQPPPRALEAHTTSSAPVVRQDGTRASVDWFRVFLVGVVLVACAVLMVRRFRHAWLERAIRRAETTTGKTREKIIAAGVERGEEEVGVLDEEIAAVRQTLPAEVTVAVTPDAEFKAHRAATAALTLSLIDAAVQPVTFANADVPLLYAVPLGVGIAAALGVAPARVFEFGFLTDENEALVLDRVKVVTKGIGIVTGVAAGVWTFARFADASTAAYLISVDQVISFTIAEGIGVLAGMLAAEAHIWRRPALRIAHRNDAARKLARREAKRTKLVAGLGRLRALGAAVLLAFAVPHAGAQVVRPTTTDRPAPGATPAAPLLVSHATSGSTPANTDPRLNGTCRIFVDRTESGDLSSRDDALRVVSDRLSELFSLINCSSVAVATLPGRDTLFMKFTWTKLPASPDSTRICARVVQRRRGLMSGFQGFKEARDAECAKSLDSARRARTPVFQRAIEEIRSRIHQTSADAIPDRTGLMLAIGLCIKRGDVLCLIISDALETAGPMRRVDIPDGQRFVMVQYLPGPGFGGVRSAGDAARAFCALVPGMNVVQYTALLEPGPLERVLTRQEPAACAQGER